MPNPMGAVLGSFQSRGVSPVLAVAVTELSFQSGGVGWPGPLSGAELLESSPQLPAVSTPTERQPKRTTCVVRMNRQLACHILDLLLRRKRLAPVDACSSSSYTAYPGLPL